MAAGRAGWQEKILGRVQARDDDEPAGVPLRRCLVRSSKEESRFASCFFDRFWCEHEADGTARSYMFKPYFRRHPE